MTAPPQVGAAPAGDVAAVPVLVPQFGPLADTWTGHLDAQLNPIWRPGEWDAATRIFTPDPVNSKTRLFRCPRPGCGAAVLRAEPCLYCSKEGKQHGWSTEELLGRPRATPPVVRSNERRAECTVRSGNERCSREALSRGLCNAHYIAFDSWARKRNGEDKTEAALQGFLANRRDLLQRLPGCTVPGCRHDRHTERTPFCNVHYGGFRGMLRKRPRATPEAFITEVAEPFVPAYSLPLVVLPRPLATELLYGMQTFDAERALAWDAANWRRLFTRVRSSGASSLLERSDQEWLNSMSKGEATGHLWRHLLTVLQVQDARFHHRTQRENVLSAHDLGLTYQNKRPNKQLRHRQRPIDLSPVTQPWLREATRHYIEVTRPHMEEVRRAERLMGGVSKHLRETYPDSDDPTRLNLGVMDGIVRLVTRTWVAQKTQENYLATWWKVVGHARSHGLWPQVPDDFMRDRKHRADGTRKHDPDDEGQALPEAVVRLLSRTLAKVGADTDPHRRSGWSPELRAAHYRILLTVLRDTGRRPGEVVSLSAECVRPAPDGSWALLWDNHKAKRFGRRLPLSDETAQAIFAWKRLRQEHAVVSDWLFPSPAVPERHVSIGTLERALRSWVAITPPLVAPVTGIDGAPVTIDLNDIILYSFRHTYAQRHADAGVSPDDLRELMDHVSIRTTMGYYRVGWRRKKAAAAKMAEYTQDRHGKLVGLAEERRGIAHVAVPFGNCAEPSNVQAGGSDCPIRFQCAGCSFYRPDPSHMPALEEHLHELRKNLAAATAMGSPPHVVDNFRGQINDYEMVLERMEATLTALPEAERQAVETHAVIMRRARAAEASGRALELIEVDRQGEQAR